MKSYILRAHKVDKDDDDDKGNKIISGHLIPTHQISHCVSITKTYRLMLFTEIIAVYSKGHTERAYTLGRQNTKL